MEARRRAELNEAMGNWLAHNWRWEWYGHFTFRGSVGVVKAGMIWCAFVKRLRKTTGLDVQWVRCTEFQEREVIHYHALFLNVKGARRLSWMDRWAEVAGWSRIMAYNPKQRGSWYIAKYQTKELGEVKFSDGLENYAIWADRGPEQLEFLA